MNSALKIGALLLCLTFLWGCAAAPEHTTAPTTAPIPAPDFRQLYDTAAEQRKSRSAYRAEFTIEKTCTVGSAVLSEQTTLEYAVSGAGTAEAVYYIRQQTVQGSRNLQLSRIFQGGKVHILTPNGAFSGEMEEAVFAAAMYPAVLLESSHYGLITGEAEGDGWKLTFSRPVAAEAWLDARQPPVFAEGEAWLDGKGALQQLSYRVEYDEGDTRIALHITAKLAPADAIKLPDIPETSVSLTDPEAVVYLLRSAGCISGTSALRSQLTEAVDSRALSLKRSQKTECAFLQLGDALQAQLDFVVTLTPDRGSPTVNTRQERYENGRFMRSLNGGAPVEDIRYTPQEVRQYCESSVLGGLVPPACLADARIVREGGEITLYLTGTQAYALQLAAGIETQLGVALGSLASEFLPGQVTGTLVLNEATGLPRELTISFSCDHVIGGVSYPLTYSLEQTLQWTAEG